MLLITSLIWGTAFVAQSEGMNYVEPFTYNAVRTLLGGIVLIPVIFLFRFIGKRGGSPPKQYSLKNTIKGGLCCGMVLFVASSFQQAGIAQTTAGKAGFVTALYIVIVPVLGLFIRKPVSLKMWLFVAAAIAGFWLLCIKEDFSISTGDLLVLVCALFFAVHIMVIDHFNEKNTDGVLMACIQFFTAAAFMLICMFVFEKPDINKIIEARTTILYSGIMSCGVAYTLQILGQRHTDPTVATLLMSLESVFAALSGWALLGEELSFKELAGCGLVFVAVVSAQLFGSEKQSKKESVKGTEK